MSEEKLLQVYVMKSLRSIGCLVYKFSSPSQRGVPDLLSITPTGETMYFEIKNPTGSGRLTRLQGHHIDLIRKQHAYAEIIISREQIDRVVAGIETHVRSMRSH